MKNLLLLILTIFLHLISAELESNSQLKNNSDVLFNNTEAKRDNFPFLVSLLRSKNHKFFCGASLISQRHALTASSCIHGKYQRFPLQPQDMIAKLGKNNLSYYETGEVIKEISQIILHEDWNPEEPHYDADIALLVFYSDVQLTDFIKTVCLPKRTQAKDLIEGQFVGFGMSDFSAPKKTMIKKPSSNEFCFLHNVVLAQISSSRTFCAENVNGGPCSGDSGRGLYVERNSIWYLQGIALASLNNEEGNCDVGTYAIYTNVALYVDWIEEKINGLRFRRNPEHYEYLRSHNPYFFYPLPFSWYHH